MDKLTKSARSVIIRKKSMGLPLEKSYWDVVHAYYENDDESDTESYTGSDYYENDDESDTESYTGSDYSDNCFDDNSIKDKVWGPEWDDKFSSSLNLLRCRRQRSKGGRYPPVQSTSVQSTSKRKSPSVSIPSGEAKPCIHSIKKDLIVEEYIEYTPVQVKQQSHQLGKLKLKCSFVKFAKKKYIIKILTHSFSRKRKKY